MTKESQIIESVHSIYQWLENELAKLIQSCAACGTCCDFESFGHRLYVTTPELIYFQQFIGPKIKPMTVCVCPYRIEGKCTVYPYRFAGCRIFTCKGDVQKENAVCEETVRRFKTLCDDYGIPYQYIDLETGLKWLSEEPQLNIEN